VPDSQPVADQSWRPLIERTIPSEWVSLYLATLALVALLIAAHGAALDSDATPGGDARAASTSAPPWRPIPVNGLPGGVRTLFEGNRMLVAYYGTAGTGSLGVLGEASPAKIIPRLAQAARDFAVGGRAVQPVFDLITTVAHAGPTRSGQYNSDIDRASVQRYIDAAHRNGVLLILNLQPGRADFLTVAKRWAWALSDPWVGLALDPEWRMSQGGIPGERIGSVDAAEINTVSQWLENLILSDHLPQKVFVVNQFRSDMIRLIQTVAQRPHLAMVQQIDGYGPPQVKLASFNALALPKQFVLGFKVFYDEDVSYVSFE
jgi:hypothetical protein